ncbi:hypothetical protein [uncultured Planococcus sp.]|uniref:hypothetical protein n=1 Tax=uncultured Planococcus sp. TaxID=337815 RepID=UPI00260D42F7|nr:hypothetical protein [uncultured Planococcus sp.]
MAVFESKYAGFSFYAKDGLKTFKNGRYVTDDKDEIAALEKAVDATRTDKPAAQEAPAAPKQKQAEDAKPAAKRKPSAK